jgi:group I intron endonuclease
MISCIYTITNVINGKIYVGKTNNFNYRINKHKYTLKNNIHINEHLQRAWNKYGESNFVFEILEEYCLDQLSSQEHYWCNMLDAFNYKLGYNIRPTHPFNKGTNSPEMIEKVKKALTGKKLSKEHKLKLSLAKKGKIMSEETKQKMSSVSKGRKKSEETKKRISEAKLGNKNPMYGKPAWNKKQII